MPQNHTENMRGVMDSKTSNVENERQQVAMMSHTIMAPPSQLVAKIKSKGYFLGVKTAQDQTLIMILEEVKLYK